jgi:hypothetical protein
VDFTTSRGVRLRIGRLPRKTLDDFAAAHPPPIPPTVWKEVFGGREQVENPNDEAYKAELFAYHLGLGYDQIEMLMPAIEVLDDWAADEKFSELCEAGAVDTSTPERARASYLLEVAVVDDDMRLIVDEIFYQSTTTDRGIREAERLFNVTWSDEDIYAWRVNTTPGKFSLFFEDRDAATFDHYNWRDFCALTGPEQSAVVAHYRLRQRLESLASRIEGK